MYINPFVAGVAATLFSEAVAFIIAVIISANKNKEKGDK